MREDTARQHAAEQRAVPASPADDRAAPSRARASGDRAPRRAPTEAQTAQRHPHGHHPRRVRSFPLAVLLLVPGCTLSACAPVDPVPTPPAEAQLQETPSPPASTEVPGEQFSPITSEAPQTTFEALENATRLTTAYTQARSHVWQHPLESAVLKHYAQMPEVEAEVHRAREAAANGWVLSGAFQFQADLSASYVQPLKSTIDETEIPFGHVTITGCEDASGVTVLNTTQPGQTATFKTPPRVRVNLIVGYNHIEQRWLLLGRHLPDGKQMEC